MLVPRFDNNLDLFLEQVPVGFVVEKGRAKSFNLSGNVSAANAKAKAASSQDIGGGYVFGEAKRMPGRQGVEEATEFQVFGMLC